MKQIEYSSDIHKEVMRLLSENHEKEMLKIEERARLSREKHDELMVKYKIQIQELLANIPKRKIYFGKVKTE